MTKSQPALQTQAAFRDVRSICNKHEDGLWVEFYRRSSDPLVAAILIEKMENEPYTRRAHPALYMRAVETVRRHEMRAATFRAMGSIVVSMVEFGKRGAVYLVRAVARCYRALLGWRRARPWRSANEAMRDRPKGRSKTCRSRAGSWSFLRNIQTSARRTHGYTLTR